MDYFSTDLIEKRRKLYSRENTFNNFKNITDEDFERIKKDVADFLEVQANQKNQFKRTRIYQYAAVIFCLTTTRAATLPKSFDEKMIFLILAVDPNLEMLKQYNRMGITPNRAINNAFDDEERLELSAKRSNELKSYETRIRNILGFYDPKMLKYEKEFNKRFVEAHTLATEVSRDYFINFIDIAKDIEDFDNITSFDLSLLRLRVELWREELGEEADYRLAVYHLLFQNEILKLRNLQEKAIFLLLIMDSDLDLLRIYEEESKWPNIQKRAKEEVGIFNHELLKLEKKYQKKFYPDIDFGW